MDALLGLSGHLHGIEEVGFPMSAVKILRSQSDIFNNKAHALLHTVKHTIYLKPKAEKENTQETGCAGRGMRHHSRMYCAEDGPFVQQLLEEVVGETQRLLSGSDLND